MAFVEYLGDILYPVGLIPLYDEKTLAAAGTPEVHYDSPSWVYE